MMPIQYTQKALEQLKKLREELDSLRNYEYADQPVVTFKTVLNYALEDIFQNGCEKSVWRGFDQQVRLVYQNMNSPLNHQWPFNFLAGKLDGYIKTIEMGIERRSVISERTDTKKSPKIFISHAHADEKAANLLVDLLHDMGIPPNDDTHEYIFCSSTPGYDIPLRKRIYEHLKNEFEHHNLYVIFLLSSNYYKRPACLNEMGATWITETNYCSVLLPGFTFSQIEGAADADAISIALVDDNAWEGLNNLRTDLQKFMKFKLSHNNFWESRRETFIENIRSLSESSKNIENKSVLLNSESANKYGTISTHNTYSHNRNILLEFIKAQGNTGACFSDITQILSFLPRRTVRSLLSKMQLDGLIRQKGSRVAPRWYIQENTEKLV